MRGNTSRMKVVGAVALAILLGAHAIAAEPTVNSSGTILEPAVWQGPEINAPSTTTSTADSTHSAVNPLRVAYQPAAPVPPQNAYVPLTGAKAPTKPPAGAISPAERAAAAGMPASPLLDGNTSTEMLPPVMDGGCASGNGSDGPLHVQAYGGGHPIDWSWGCGGSPYREGPGMCDNYKVGPRWHVTVDGIVMSREQTTLSALEAQMRADNTFMSIDGTAYGGGTSDSANVLLTPQDEDFHYGPGGRVTFTSQVGRCTGYDIEVAYEGINNWNASVVFPKESLLPTSLVITPNPNTEPNASTPGPLAPPDPRFPEGFVQRSLHYRSDMNTVELNFLTNANSDWRPFFGVRFLRFDDEINDFLNQDRQAPLAGPLTAVAPGLPPGTLVNDPIGPTSETDRLNMFHLDNNLMGFQMGMLHDTLRLTDRFAIEGFLNAGVYYNQVKYSNVMGVFTTQTFADNTRVGSGSRVDVSNIVNNDSRDISEISYMTEASLTGVCRLNKCWALRGGYQFMWMDHIHTAQQAYLGNPNADSDLMFQGWHAGLECRR